MSDQYAALAVVIAEILPIVMAHKKMTLLVVLFHIWVYGLAIHHIGELKSLMELLPFFGQ